jgi:hypothetical protein
MIWAFPPPVLTHRPSNLERTVATDVVVANPWVVGTVAGAGCALVVGVGMLELGVLADVVVAREVPTTDADVGARSLETSSEA